MPVSFKVTGGQEDVNYRLTAHNELYIMTTTPLTISTTEPIGADHIVVDTGTTGDPARLTFDGVTIISGDRPINILVAPNPATSTDYPVLVGSEDLYKPSTLRLVQDAVTTYDGSAVTSDEVVAQASQGAQDVTGELVVSYAPEGTDDFAEGLPRDAGTYRVRVSLPQRLVEGVWYSPATAETTLTVQAATPTFQVTNQKLADDATLSDVSAPETGAGVTLSDGTVETVTGTLTWHASSDLSGELAADTPLASLAQDDFVTLWWSFVPDSANYASPVTGSTVIVLEEAVEPTPDQPCDDPAEKPGSQTTQRPTEGSGQPSPSAPIASNAQAVPETGTPAPLRRCLPAAWASRSPAWGRS